MSLTTRSHLNGYLLILGGAILFSTKAIMVKLAFRNTHVDAISLLALRMMFSLPFFLVTGWLAARKHSSQAPLTRLQWMYIIGLGLLGYYLSSLLDFLGLQYITAGMERLILFLYPTFTVIINALLFREAFTKRQIIALVLSYIGIIFAFYNEIKLDVNKSDFLLGSGLIFLCSITYAGYLVGTGRLVKQIHVMRYTSIAMLSATVGVMIHYFISGQYGLKDLHSNMISYGLLLAIVATVIPNFMVAAGIQTIGSNNAAIVSAIGPVSTIILAYFFLGERFDHFQMIGTLFVIAGVLMIGWKGNANDFLRKIGLGKLFNLSN